MTARRSRIKLAFSLVALAFIAILLWKPIKQARDVAAVQESLDRAWEITFESGSRPTRMPEFLDKAASEVTSWIFAETGGYNGSTPARGRNRDDIHLERFRGLFRGPIEFVGIYYPEGFHGDELGAALARFEYLRRLAIFENEDSVPTEADWTTLCARLRTLPHLEEIELGGAQITDAALSRLAGHPGLRVVEISYSRVTPKVGAVFATMPHLLELRFGDHISAGDLEFTQEEQDAIATEMSGTKVKIKFRY